MGLNQEQLDKANEFKKQAEAYEHLMKEMPENVSSAWYRFVGQMRECFYMDEQWDGEQMTFLSKGKVSVKALLQADKITVIVDDEHASTVISTPVAVDEIIQTLITKQLPERIMPTENVQLSSGGGFCALCWYNRENSEKQDNFIDFVMGFALCYGHICESAPCESNHNNCLIDDIGHGTPGMTAEQVTHILFPYWWAKSKFNVAAE